LPGCLLPSFAAEGRGHQGSVLGPILICTSITDILAGLPNRLHLYAYDATLNASRKGDVDSCATTTHSLQYDLGTFSELSKRWQLNFNANKCESMVISTSRVDKSSKVNLILNNQPTFNKVEKPKCAGLTFGNKLSRAGPIVT
jgi:hypothetical protein